MDLTKPTELRTDGGDRRTSHSSVERKECLSCGGQLHPDVEFCRHCGVESPFGSTPAAESTTSEETTTTDAVVTDGDHDETVSTVDTTAGSKPAPSTPEPHPVTAVAEQLQNDRSFSTDAARELCGLLSDPQSDDAELKEALETVVKATETRNEVTAAVDSLGESPRPEQLEPIQRELSRIDGELSKTVATVLSDLDDCRQKVAKYRSERDEFREETRRLRRGLSRQTDVSFDAETPLASLQNLTDELRNDNLVLRTPTDAIPKAASEVERSVDPLSPNSREFLNGLRNPESAEITHVLRTTVEALDEYDTLRTALTDISDRDVRRQLDSLDTDLQQKNEPVYRHLADRIRELEAMVDREAVDRIQLYAIYQESRFYDRTLIPRLSRTTQSSDSVDVGQQLADIESRIEAIRTEYVAVRADHNHTIPNHFLELADSLHSRAKRLERKQPRQAAGIVAAAAELLGHIEQLYERNEYSVMLRQLRG